MARPLRIEYEGGLYHITCKGNEGKDIFIDDHDRIRFLGYLEKNINRYNVIIYAYCLMGNHYHLFSETMEANLSRFMHALNTSYTVYFNRRHQRIGHLFQGRYKAIIVDKDAYLLELTRYIHLNPIRAGIVTDPEKYRWSSHRSYLDMNKENKLINPDVILSMFSSERGEAVKRYRIFVNEGIGEQNLLKDVVGQVILGRDVFIKEVKGRINIDISTPEISNIKEIKSVTPEDIFMIVSKEFNITDEEIKKRRRGWLPRKLAMYLLRNYTTLALREIGEIFNTGYANISSTAKEVETLIMKDPKLQKQVDKLLQNLKLKT